MTGSTGLGIADAQLESRFGGQAVREGALTLPPPPYDDPAETVSNGKETQSNGT